MYILIYKKHNIGYRYKGPRSGVSQSFMYNRRSNSTDSVSLLWWRLPLGTVGAEGKQSPPCNVFCVHVSVCVLGVGV